MVVPLCTDKEINQFFFISTFQLDRDSQDDNRSKLQLFIVLNVCKFSQSSKFMQVPAQYIILFGGSYIHHCKVFLKNTCIIFQMVSFKWLNNKLKYLLQYPVPIFYADNNKMVYVISKLYCICEVTIWTTNTKSVSIFRNTSWLLTMFHMLNITQVDDGQPKTARTEIWLVS